MGKCLARARQLALNGVADALCSLLLTSANLQSRSSLMIVGHQDLMIKFIARGTLFSSEEEGTLLVGICPHIRHSYNDK